MPIPREKLCAVFGDSYIGKHNIRQKDLNQKTANLQCLKFCLDYLRGFHRDPEITEMFTALFKWIEKEKSVRVVQSLEIEEVTPSVTTKYADLIILLPGDFSQRFESNMISRMGEVVCAGFQAVYYVSNPTEGLGSKSVLNKASVTEGRFFTRFFETSSLVKPNEYQNALIHVYKTALPNA